MTVFLITYDLNHEVSRPPIVQKIKEIGTGWAKLSESSYAVTSSSSPQQIYSSLKSMLDGDDNLYVITLKKPYFGQGPKDVNQWLETNLTL